MKTMSFQRVLLLSAFYFFFFAASPAQNSGPDSDDTAIGQSHLPQPLTSAATQHTSQTAPAVDCDADVVAPQIQCPSGSYSPGARAAYLVSYSYGEPWGISNNIYAMEYVFGYGNWDHYYIEYTDAATLLSPAYKVIFLEGSYTGGYALDNFLTANLPALENWVSAGGALFINCAPIYSFAPPSINLGFGGVAFQNHISEYDGMVLDPGHPIFNGPFVPASGDFSGTPFSYAHITGPAGVALITGASNINVILAEKTRGAGKVIWGSMIMPTLHSPSPNGQNMRQNILAYLNEHRNNTVMLPADQNACTAAVPDQSLDASATDDCVLASLTHDFAAAPSNTTLAGAVFPVGSTPVRWTAMDAAGNTTVCDFSVFVREPEAPVMTCPDDFSVPADPGSCGAIVHFTVTATDNCTAAPTIFVSSASGDYFPVGATTIQASATDESGNQSDCLFTVAVTPNPEICNGLDDDCDGFADDDAPGNNVFYADNDDDGYGDPNNTVLSCIAPIGCVENADDCDDTNYNVRPGMYEICNGLDDNCNGQIDEGLAATWYADNDGDGYGDPNNVLAACDQPAGYTWDDNDCDDTTPYIRPGAVEDCTNLVDENCDGVLGTNAFTIAETHTDVYCGSTPDGSISLTVTPAQNYSYHWNNGACCGPTLTNLAPGTYKVTVTNECGTTKTKTIKVKPPLVPALKVSLSGIHLKCAGDANGAITVTPKDGCGGYTYFWPHNGSTSASLTGLPGGYYEVIVTDACGCTKVSGFAVTEPSPLNIAIDNVIPLQNGKYFVQISGWEGTPPYKYRRSTLAGGYTNWGNNNGFNNLPPGSYVFEVRDKNGCISQVSLDLANAVPGSSEPPVVTDEEASPDEEADTREAVSPAPTVSVYPNPANGEINIAWTGLDSQSPTVQIFNQVGQLVQTLTVPEGAARVGTDVAGWPGGVYFVKVLSNKQDLQVVRFVKAE